jgi:class 3 adenylate cyclase
VSSTLDRLEAGREAIGRYAWDEAYTQLVDADREEELGAADLQALAEAAFWSGRPDESLAARERAHRAHLQEGDRLAAATTAMSIALAYLDRGDVPLYNGWFAKAERLLDGEAPSGGHAFLELTLALHALVTGDLDRAFEQAQKAYDLAIEFGDRSVEALALVQQGRILLVRGELDRGLRLLDESTTTALGGDVDPLSSCMVYCMTITSCCDVGDIDRARRWTEAANRWCDKRDLGGYSGACRVHRAEILRLGGDWGSAEREALSACGTLAGYDQLTRSAGHYEIGEINRRRGDFAAAEEAYRTAQELGREPQPGLALLRLAQGRLDDAHSGLRRALAEEDLGPLDRARLLPAHVEVSLAAGDVDAARTAVAELLETADRFRVDGKRTPLLDGNLQLASGQIELYEGQLDEAERCLRKALATWSGVGAPYEVARTRMLLGSVYERVGDRAGAREQYEAARATFERLGAVLDAQRALEPLGAAETRRTFLFTDIVESTKLLDALGNAKWSKLLDRHDELVRGAIERDGGEVIKHTGDGFFAAFDTPGAAVASAVAIQRSLDDEMITVRVGVHSGEALERGDDYAGRGVNVAARVGALAGGEEVLVSSESLAGAELPYGLSEPRQTELKGFEEPIELVSVDWRSG